MEQLWTDKDPETGKTYKELWNDGWEAGNNMAKSLNRPVMNTDFPKDFHHRGGVYWSGYAEGVLSGSKYEPK